MLELIGICSFETVKLKVYHSPQALINMLVSLQFAYTFGMKCLNNLTVIVAIQPHPYILLYHKQFCPAKTTSGKSCDLLKISSNFT